MLLDRFGQSNKFWKKSWKKFWDIQVWVLWRSSRGCPENFLGTSETTSQERPLNVRLGRLHEVRLGRPQDGQIGSLGDVLGRLEGDVVGTSWGPIFAGWVVFQTSVRNCLFLRQVSRFFQAGVKDIFVWILCVCVCVCVCVYVGR